MSARRLIGVCAVLAVAVVGCGGSGPDEAAQQSTKLRVAYMVAGSSELLTLDLGAGRPRSHRGGWWPEGSPRALSTPAWSPDGERLAYFEWASPDGITLFVDNLAGEREAVAQELTGREAPDLSTAPPQAPLWSPDGRKLAFRRADANVEVVSVDGGDAWTVPTRRLAVDWYAIWLAWAPDGERLAVTIDHGRRGGTWIADRTRLRPFRPQGATVRDPAWSPDGRWIAYSRADARGNRQLMVSDAESVNTLRVTNDVPNTPGQHFSNRDPAWSPGGSKIAFLSDRDGRHSAELFVVGADGTGQRRLTRDVSVTEGFGGFGGARPPAVRWSPDGGRLAFLGWGWLRHPQIGVVDVSEGAPHKLAPAPLDEGYLAGHDLAWLGAPELGRARVPTGAVPERLIRVVRDHLPEGHARLGAPRALVRARLDRDAVSHAEPVDVSPDGSHVSFLRRLGEHRFEVGVVSLRDGSRRVLATGASPGNVDRGGHFSRDGRRILFRRWTTLRTVDPATRALRTVAVGVGLGPSSWLTDGRVAYLDRAGRLRLSGAERSTTVRAGVRRQIVVSPDGELAVVRRECEAELVAVATGRRKGLGVGLVPDENTWSPDGSLVALHRPEYDECGRPIGTKGGDVVLFDRSGRELGALLGMREPLAAGATFHWAHDSSRLVATVSYSGTRPPPSPLYVFSAADRTVGGPAHVLGSSGFVVGATRDRLVFVRYRPSGEWELAAARL